MCHFKQINSTINQNQSISYRIIISENKNAHACHNHAVLLSAGEKYAHREQRKALVGLSAHEGEKMERSSRVVDILRNAFNYGILRLLLIKANATHLEN